MKVVRTAMQTKQKLRISVDLAMIILLPLLMAYELVGEEAHEWIGICMLLLFFLHHILNFAWHKNLAKGRYAGVRNLGTVINIFLSLIMLSQMVSGIMMSRHVFLFLPLDNGMSVARIMHLLGSYWGFFLMSLHAGLHGNMLMGMVKGAANNSQPSAVRTVLLRTAAVLVAAYGAYAFINRGLASYMFLQNQFVFFDFSEPRTAFFADYVAIMFLFACLGYYASNHSKS